MEYLIQQNLINKDQLQEIKDAILNLPHKFISIIPFSYEIISDGSIEGDQYIPYGSTLLTTIGTEIYNWSGLYFDLINFNYKKYCENRSDMLNCDVILTVKDSIEFLSRCKPDKFWFIRPSLDLKQFSGIVLPAIECAEFLSDAMECESSGSYKLEKDTVIVISEPKIIQAEWRWFIVGGKVIDGSMYRFQGQIRKEHVIDQELIKEAQEKADQWIPNQCCTMDLALVNSELKVIEFNCINSSGFYDNDVGLILNKLYQYTITK